MVPFVVCCGGVAPSTNMINNSTAESRVMNNGQKDTNKVMLMLLLVGKRASTSRPADVRFQC